MMLRAKFIGVLLVSSCVLTACGSVKDELGLSRRSPDEFAVLERAPLEIPKDLSVLPLPAPGVVRPQETPATTMAKSAVLGDQVAGGRAATVQASSAEQALISKAGATQPKSDIRAVVNREAADNVDDHRVTVKRLLDFGQDKPPATVVDPAAEAKRILDTKQKGLVVTGDGTPTLEE